MKYTIIPVTPFQQNCTLAWCPATRKAVVVDPGGDVAEILAHVEAQGVEVEKILLTHGHLDHVGGAEELAARLQVPIHGPHPEDAFWLQGLPQQAQMFGVGFIAAFTPDQWLHQGDEVRFGEQRLQVFHCPGHTPGHVVFFHAVDRLALVGDVLFQGSIGRTDFPRGDFDTLIRAIMETLLPLGDDIDFISGHGPMSSFGAERRSNPFLPR